jgi:hypothetical protein
LRTFFDDMWDLFNKMLYMSSPPASRTYASRNSSCFDRDRVDPYALSRVGASAGVLPVGNAHSRCEPATTAQTA